MPLNGTLRKRKRKLASEGHRSKEARKDVAAEKVDDVQWEERAGGLISVADVVVGSGERVVKHSSSVDVAYTASVGSKKIDTATAKEPYSFVVGANEVVKGLSLGVKGMRLGGRRKILVRYELGYGAKGRPPKVPPKSTLLFDVEILEIGVGFVPSSSR